MHVSVRTLHGVRALSTLAESPETPRSARELADQKYIDNDYLTQILNTLTNEGVIQSKKGPSGGYYLGRDPGTVTLREIVAVLEGPTVVSPCTEPEHSDCEIIQECSTQNVLTAVADEIDRLLDRITLEDIRTSSESEPVELTEKAATARNAISE